MHKPILAISSPSFCKNAKLRDSVRGAFPDWDIRFWEQARELEGAEFVAFLREAKFAIVGKEKIASAVLQELPRLRALSKYGVGVDNIDFAACAAHDVKVLFKPGVNAPAVAELTLGLTLSVLRKIGEGDRGIRQAAWKKDGGLQLSGRTVLLVGCGAVGSRAARLFRAFGCALLLCDILDKSALAREVGGGQCSLVEALPRADVVSLHVPLTPDTQNLIQGKTLQLFKKGSVLINTSRGAVVDLEALKLALKEGILWGVGLDVFPVEPFFDAELLALPNVVVSPHIAGNAEEAVLAMGEAAIEGLREVAYTDLPKI